ncbi:MAG: LuxR family transcriptional regulator [Alphaproteobacteria bacterium]|nr:LuxR family transcriptional regulator [Alphaproteobacteria bacterium]MCB9975677.1 LuxR family transcriptional regulator [Rhodospirillales bacterium]
MVSIEEFIEDTNKACSTDELSSLLGGALAGFGYDRFCYSLISDHDSLNLKAGHGILRNYPESWMKHYVSNRYVGNDPVPLHCFRTIRPFTWSYVTQNLKISKFQKRIMDEANESKLLDGMAVPIHGINGELSGVGMASSAGGVELNEIVINKIRAFCFQFHMAYTALLTAEENADGGIFLTDREREVLLWAAEGKSDAVIADILGISYSTVRFHINNAYNKLSSNERIYAVTKAIRLGLIMPSAVSERI